MDVLDEPTWMCSRRVKGGTPNFLRIPDRPVPTERRDTGTSTERRDTGTYLLRHAASPSMGRSGADIHVGSRSQEVGTRIPA